MKNGYQPLVSIGVPVYNGEKGLAAALDSLLNQNYSNLEIIISDNGSKDSTSKICEEYVQKDSRIQFSRSEKNLGSIWNFNRVFELSSGKYFMWAAHDDQRDLSFVNACVEKMEECPEAAVCHPHQALYVEGREEVLCVYNLNSFEMVTGLVERYRETLKHFPPLVIYGLHRSSALRKTQLLQKSIASDVAFIQELSIHGDFVQVPRILFNYFNREKWNTIDQDYFVFFGKKKKPWWYLPFIILFIDHWKRVAGSVIPFKIKLRLWSILIAYEARQVSLKLLIKLAGWLCPNKWSEKLGCAIYWRWVASPNMKNTGTEYYFERAIKPRLGWWR